MSSYPKRYCCSLTVANRAVTLGENVVLCIRGVGSLPSTFYFLYNIQDPNAQDSYPVYISTRDSGNVHLVDSALNIVTYGDLVYNSIYSVAKINVCSNGDNCSNQQTTYFQLIGSTVSGGTTANFL